MGEAQKKGGQAGHGVIAPELARRVTAGEGKRGDWETCTMVAHTLRGEGFDASEDGTGRGTPLVPVHVRDVAATLGGRMRGQDDACADNLLPVDFSCKDYGNDAGELAPTLRAMGSSDGRPNGGGQVAVCTGFIPKAPPNSRSMGETVELAPTVNTHQAGQGVQQGMAVRRLTPTECERLQGFPDGYTLIPTTMVTHRKACEWHGTKEVVLPGTERAPCGCKAKFVPVEKCPDGPRYKALGNSWAVPCARWIGERIDAQLRAAQSLEAAA